jgi:hypothetical protein
MNTLFVSRRRHHGTWLLICLLLIAPVLALSESHPAAALELQRPMPADQTDPRQMKFPPVALNPPEPERTS